jgi:hypothetical protein
LRAVALFLASTSPLSSDRYGLNLVCSMSSLPNSVANEMVDELADLIGMKLVNAKLRVHVNKGLPPSRSP